MTKRLLVVGVLILTALPFVAPDIVGAVGAATAPADCGIAESGVAQSGTGTWTTVNGLLTVNCDFDDAALPPIFPRTSLGVSVSFGSIVETDAAWQEQRNGIFGEAGWGVELGNPIDFVAESFFLTPVWDCTNQVRDPQRCSINQGASARPHECAVAGVGVSVAGVDGVPWLLDESLPPIEWELSRRVIQKVTTLNVGSLPADAGCSQSCTFAGDVSAPNGEVLFAEVEVVRLGRTVAHGDTGSRGRYSLVAPCDGLSDRDPDRQPRVRVRLRQADGWWQVSYREQLVVIESSPISGTGAFHRREFDFKTAPPGYRTVGTSAPPANQWWEWVEIYNNIAHAWAMAETLQQIPNEALPLEIHANCNTALCRRQSGSDYAFFTRGADPYIAFGSDSARFTDSGRPDNREYHEFGHAVFHDGQNLEPTPGSVGGHAGNLNNSTASSLTEGFAEWFAVMVNKHINGRATPHIYNPGGIGRNLELNDRAFDGFPFGPGGKFWVNEEYAVAGLLLDLEDGPDDYDGQVDIQIDTSGVADTALGGGVGRKVSGTITNRVNGFKREIHVNGLFWRNDELVHVTTTRSRNRLLRPRGTDTFEIIIPAAIPYDRFDLVVTRGGPAGGSTDDDPIDLTARQVAQTMKNYRRGNETGVVTMTDVYRAFKALLGEVDTDRDGVADVDQVFIAHGFFTRGDGDDVYEPGVDTIGRTDRSAGEVRNRISDPLPVGRTLDVSAAPDATEFLVVSTPAAPFGYLSSARVVTAVGGFINLPTQPAGIGGWTHVIAHYSNGDSQLIDLVSSEDLQQRVISGKATVADIDAPRTAAGYRLLEANGVVHTFGTAAHLGDLSGSMRSGERAVAMATTASTNGYIILTSQNRIASAGDAPPLFSRDDFDLKTGEGFATLSITPDDTGYWAFTNKGRVVEYGSARFFGDVSHLALAGDIIASVATPSGNGYYLLGSDGGVFAFGDAEFFGSIPQVLPGVQLTCPVVGIVPTPSGRGYWMVACDGGVFAFGDAGFVGSLPGLGVVPVQPINGMVAFGGGYLMVAADGGAFNFGAPFFGSLGNVTLNNAITAITPYFG